MVYTNSNIISGDINEKPIGKNAISKFETTNGEENHLCEQFRNLFSGREDCWGILKGGCEKENLTDAHYLKHLHGEESLGIFPLLKDGKCNFAIVDFDFKSEDDRENMAREYAKKLVDELGNIDIGPCWTEISKSGLKHVWIFFQEPVKAKSIRNLLKSVLTDLGLKVANGTVEIFPKQDSLEEGQVGNYIHLPYFGAAAGSIDTRVIVDSETLKPLRLKDFLQRASENKVSSEQLENAVMRIDENELQEDDTYIEMPCSRLSPDNKQVIIETMKPYWKKGQRNQLTLCLSGLLAKQGISREDTLDIVIAIARLCGDSEISERKKTVNDTYRKFGKHQDILGYSGLKDILKAYDLEKLSSLFTSKSDFLLSKDNDWPRPLSPAAFNGLAGEIIKIIEPKSEADSAALLVNFLVGFGNLIGTKFSYEVEAHKHPGRLFAVLVGNTSKARKGTSWGHIKDILVKVDSNYEDRIQSGLSSGEGLIFASCNQSDEENKLVDKRLLLIEEEFSSVLRRANKDGNTLSQIIRSAWDSGNLQTITKRTPLRTKNAHISIIGHTTSDELLRDFKSTEMANGFGNRFLWVRVSRSKELPFGGSVNQEELKPLIQRLREVLEYTKDCIKVEWAEETIPLWVKEYSKLSKGTTGVVGAMTARAEAYVVRIASLYAILDKSAKIRPEHLYAAMEVWRYSEDSVKYIFGYKSDNSLESRILRYIRSNSDGVTKTQISGSLSRNVESEDIRRCLEKLEFEGNIKSEDLDTGGRRKTIYKPLYKH